VQKTRCLDIRNRQGIDVTVVDQQDMAGLFHIDDEFRVLVRGNDRGYARLGMIFLRIDRHAAG
jgi:hypothetical protein